MPPQDTGAIAPQNLPQDVSWDEQPPEVLGRIFGNIDDQERYQYLSPHSDLDTVYENIDSKAV
jgi:hypothetical protein